MKQKVWWFFLVLTALSAPLFAQSEDGTENASRIANVKVWVAPARGGTEKAREYFDFNMPEEVRGSGYQLAESMAGSDFYILFTLEHDEEYGDEMITAELYTTNTGELIISNSMGYTAVEDMNDWNLTMIYQLMANAPLHKYITTYEWNPPPPPRKPLLGFPEYKLWVGLRLGYSNRHYSIRDDVGKDKIEKSFGRGNSFEGGIQVSYQALKFLAVQGELLFTGDKVPFRWGELTASNQVEFYKKSYDSTSMMIPLTVKGTFLFDKIVVNPFVGGYFLLPLGSLKGEGVTSGYSYKPPLGFTVGIEAGLTLGKWGIPFLDIRYSGDLGEMTRSNGDAIYKRSAVSITGGYRFGFIKAAWQQPQSKYEIPEDIGNNDF
jgi:hypothetical protein